MNNYQDLFIAMHKAKVHSDGKIIADAVPKIEPESILLIYHQEKDKPNFNFKEFIKTYFKFKESVVSNFVSDTSKSPQQHIEKLWEVLKRTADVFEKGSSRLPLPYSYIVPGGRFNEIYYWDSYFTMLGLQISRQVDIIQNMIDNFAYLINTFGFIPNGNRTYFLGRSQPPFFALMITLLAEEKGKEIYQKYLSSMLKEYNFWTEGSTKLNEEQINFKRVIKLSEGTLNRYWDTFDTPRPEMYLTDIETAEAAPHRPAPQLFRDLRAACESGWDFSSRWLRQPQDLTTIHTTEILPIDLNCLLWNLEKTLAEAFDLQGEKAESERFRHKAEQRKTLILQYFWDDTSGFFMDFDFVQQRPKNVFSLAAMFPLFFQLATENQAKHCAARIEKDFLQAGGVVSTTLTTTQQWDAPNGWAPLQWVTIQGLRNYGFDDLAAEIKRRWVALNTKVYYNTGKMLEKYNVVATDLETGGGEYPVQDGFGWTNGVLLRLLSE